LVRIAIAFLQRYLQLASLRQEVDEAIDTLHVACAEAVNSDYLITCDKRLINQCVGLTMKVINPVDFVLEMSSDDPS